MTTVVTLAMGAEVDLDLLLDFELFELLVAIGDLVVLGALVALPAFLVGFSARLIRLPDSMSEAEESVTTQSTDSVKTNSLVVIILVSGFFFSFPTKDFGCVWCFAMFNFYFYGNWRFALFEKNYVSRLTFEKRIMLSVSPIGSDKNLTP